MNEKIETESFSIAFPLYVSKSIQIGGGEIWSIDVTCHRGGERVIQSAQLLYADQLRDQEGYGARTSDRSQLTFLKGTVQGLIDCDFDGNPRYDHVIRSHQEVLRVVMTSALLLVLVACIV